MKRNLFFMYAISFFQGMVFYSSIATLYRQAAGKGERMSVGHSLIILKETLFNRSLLF